MPKNGEPLGDQHTLAWSVEGSRFELQVAAEKVALCLPDGQVIELSSREWFAVARAIGMVVSEPNSANELTVKKGSTRPKAPKSGARWTEEEDSDLLRRWKNGETVDDLMVRFDRNEGGVTSRLVRLQAASSRDDIMTESRRRRRGKRAVESTPA